MAWGHDDFYAQNPAGMAGVFPAGSQRKKVANTPQYKKVTYTVVDETTGNILGEFHTHKATQEFLKELGELYPFKMSHGHFGVDVDPPDHDWSKENG